MTSCSLKRNMTRIT